MYIYISIEDLVANALIELMERGEKRGTFLWFKSLRSLYIKNSKQGGRTSNLGFITRKNDWVSTRLFWVFWTVHWWFAWRYSVKGRDICWWFMAIFQRIFVSKCFISFYVRTISCYPNRRRVKYNVRIISTRGGACWKFTANEK